MNISKERLHDLNIIQEKIGYNFNDIELLNTALTHKSYVNENRFKNGLKHNERLEFLGDAVLDLVITEYIFNKYTDYREGTLAKIRSSIVNSKSLYQKSKSIDLGNFLLLGKGEEGSGGRKRFSNLTNSFEAVIGALFLDSNFEVVKTIILPFFISDIIKIISDSILYDYKSLLQEYTQKKYKNRPVYKLISTLGPEHSRRFKMEVHVNNEVYGEAIGITKKDAEMLAAKKALKKLDLLKKRNEPK